MSTIIQDISIAVLAVAVMILARSIYYLAELIKYSRKYSRDE